MDPAEKEYFNAVLIVVIVVGTILLYFVITAIRYQRRSLRLHKEKIQAEIDTLENERKRIASDLHDELGPLLSAVKLQINNLETTDTDDKQLVLLFRLLQCLIAPWIPLNRVVSMLKQVGAAFVDEMIGMLIFFVHFLIVLRIGAGMKRHSRQPH